MFHFHALIDMDAHGEDLKSTGLHDTHYVLLFAIHALFSVLPICDCGLWG